MAFNPTYVNLNPIEASLIQQRNNRASPLDALLQGGQQGLQLGQLPQQLQDQALARQLNNALTQQKINALQNPDAAFARKLQEELALKGALNPDLGIERAAPGLEGKTINTPSAITPEQQAALQENPTGPIPTAAPGAPITPISFNGIQTGLNTNPNTPEKAAADKLDRQIRLANAKPVQNMLVQGANGIGVIPKSGNPDFTSLEDKNGNPILPRTATGRLGGLTANARINAIKYMGKYGVSLDQDANLSKEEQGVYNAALAENQSLKDKAEAKDLKQISDKAEVLAKDVESNKSYQEYRTVSGAAKDLRDTLQYAKSNPNDQTGIKSASVDFYQKVVNPGSVVRQTAFAQTTAGQSILNRIDNFWNGLDTGQTLTKDQIQTMVDLTDKFEQSAKENAIEELSSIKNRGDKSKINPNEYYPKKLTNDNTPSGTPSKIGRFTITVH